MFSIMDMHIKKTNEPKLPVIYPMILYTGANSYNYSTNFFDLFGDNKQLAEDIIWRPHQLIEIAKIPDEKLRTQYEYGIAMLIMKHIYDTDFLPFLTQISQLIIDAEKECGNDYIISLISYTMNSANIKDKEKFFKFFTSNLSTVNEEQIMTLADQFRLEGLQQGVEKGEENKAKVIAMKMLAEGMRKEDVSRITELDLDQLEQLDTRH